jgi:hypothetical protein
MDYIYDSWRKEESMTSIVVELTKISLIGLYTIFINLL